MNHHKLLSKNSVGSAGLLMFLIVVSQARLFDFLIRSPLGRLFLIVTLLCLSYCHQMLGIVAVLVIIIASNHFGLHLITEGFDTPITNGDKATISPTITDDSKDTTKNQATVSPAAEPSQPITSVSTTDKKTKEKATEINDATHGLEGFDVLGIENNLKRGKQSNTIPVSSFSRQDSDFISAYEGASSIFGNFSLF